MDFTKIAPYLSDPLVLIGFVLFLGFSFSRAILRAGIIPQLTARLGYRVLQRILFYGFVIALTLIVLGFGLKYRELSRAEQAAVIRMLDRELEGNYIVLGELSANIQTIVGRSTDVARVLRTPGIKILPVLFPEDNLDVDANVPASADLAMNVLQKLEVSGLLNDAEQRDKLVRAASAIAGTIGHTLPTIGSLADAGGQRYVVTSEVWTSQLPVLRRIDIIDVTLFQQTYQNLHLARANYNVVVERSADYLKSLQVLFSEPDDKIVRDRQKLAAALASERLFVQLARGYLRKVTEDMEKVKSLRDKIRADLRAKISVYPGGVASSRFRPYGFAV